MGTSGTYITFSGGSGLTGGGVLNTNRSLAINWGGTTADGVVTYDTGDPVANANFTFDGTTAYINGALGVGTSTPTTTGLIRATNDIVAYYSSDRRLKDNITPIDGALEKLDQIEGVYFDWIPMEGIHENEGHDIGVIAQEIEKVLPEVVTTRDNGYKAVKYEKLVAFLIQTVKELKVEIDELKNR